MPGPLSVIERTIVSSPIFSLSWNNNVGDAVLGTFLENTGLIFPIWTMETTGPALRADPIASAVIVIEARNLCHQCFKGSQSSGCHIAHVLISFLRHFAVSAWQNLPALGNKKRGFASCSKVEYETNPLSHFMFR